MKVSHFFVSIFCLILIAGCTKESPVSPSNELVVVRAYLYANEPVTEIQLCKTLPLGSEDAQAPPINDADVSLIKNNVRYALQASPGDSGYYHYPGNDLTVQTGDTFQIDVSYGGQNIHAETTVPPAPGGLAVSSDTLVVSDDFGSGMGGFGGEDTTQTVKVSWNEESNAMFYVVIENLESDPEPINTFMPEEDQPTRRMISEPTSSNEYRIRRFNLSYYGKHRVKVYRVNEEYADLYESRQQDSRDLNEPSTNIQNGLGIFSSFNSSEVNFIVVNQ
jgi:hypothetical protein